MIEFLEWAPLVESPKPVERKRSTPRRRYWVGGDEFLTQPEIAERLDTTAHAVNNRCARYKEGPALLAPIGVKSVAQYVEQLRRLHPERFVKPEGL